MTNDLTCTKCGDPLDEAEQLAPEVFEGLLMCDACYCEQAHFPCSLCGECGEVEVQHRYVVVFDSAEAFAAKPQDAPLPGLYRVDSSPYFTLGVGGPGWLHPRALTWLGFLPAGFQAPDDAYPAGHLCAECQRQVCAALNLATLQGIAAVMQEGLQAC